jgi:RNA-binding protein
VTDSSREDAGAGPAPTAGQRRELRSRSNRIKARLVVGRKRLTEALLDEVRGELQRNELIKVRLEAEAAGEAELLAVELAEKAPCHLIQRIGRVALLYRQRGEGEAE